MPLYHDDDEDDAADHKEHDPVDEPDPGVVVPSLAAANAATSVLRRRSSTGDRLCFGMFDGDFEISFAIIG